ncbi:MAG: hypothetical protein PHS41_05315 [Victivallaceae bacterium]|nr:hypothetical protein [Victivallaceae bacterium]
MKYFFYALWGIFAVIVPAAANPFTSYNPGNDFAVVRPAASGSLDNNNTLLPGTGIAQNRPELNFDPLPNGFEKRAVFLFEIPSGKELESRLVKQVLFHVKMQSASASAAAQKGCSLFLGDYAGPAKITPEKFSDGDCAGTLIASGQKLNLDRVFTLDVTSFCPLASRKMFRIQFAHPDEEMSIDFASAELEIRFARQSVAMRDGKKPFGRFVCDFSDPSQWEMKVVNLSGKGTADYSRSHEMSFFGGPSGRVVGNRLDSGSTVLFKAKKPFPMGKNFDNLEIWTCGMRFSYGIRRRISLTIRDTNGKTLTGRPAQNLASQGPYAHIWDFRGHGKAFDPTREYFLEEVKIQDFGGTNPKEDFYLGPITVHTHRALIRQELLPVAKEIKLPALPSGMAPDVTGKIQCRQLPKDTYEWTFEDTKGKVQYTFRPGDGSFDNLLMTTADGSSKPLLGGGVIFAPAGRDEQILSGKCKKIRFQKEHATLEVEFESAPDGRKIAWTLKLFPVKNTLAIDVSSGEADRIGGVSLGKFVAPGNLKLLEMPYLVVQGRRNGRIGPRIVNTGKFFFLPLMDFYFSNANDFFSDNRQLSSKEAFANGGSFYFPDSAGKRHTLRDRVLLCASGRLENVLPEIPNPQLVQNFDELRKLYYVGLNWMEPQFVRKMQSMGMQNLFVWLFWWGTPGFFPGDYKVRAAHGDPAYSNFDFCHIRDGAPHPGIFREMTHLQVKQQILDAGYQFGLFSYLTDINPTSKFYDRAWLQRNAAMQPSMGCLSALRIHPWALPLYQKAIAEDIQRHWGKVDGVYSDVITYRPFYGHVVSMEAGTPGCGKADLTPYAQLCKQELDSFRNTFSEGYNHWLYAGMHSGSYGQILTANPKGPSVLPLMPLFAVNRYNPKSMLLATTNNLHRFFQRSGKTMPRQDFHNDYVSQCFAAILGYGAAALHCQWDVSHTTWFGVAKMYYLFSPIQQHYLLRKASVVEYWNGKEFVDASEAVRSGSYLDGRLRIVYDNGTEILVNYNGKESWQLPGKELLPPWGFRAEYPAGKVLSCAVMRSGKRCDFSLAPDVVYADGWNQVVSVPGLEIHGAGAVRKGKKNNLSFYPLGRDNDPKNAPDLGVKYARIDLKYFYPERNSFSVVTVTAVDSDGGKTLFPCEQENGKVTIRPAKGFRNYLVELNQK